jgi:hypothetical protein
MDDFPATPEHNKKLREILLSKRPDWKGKLWIYPESVSVRGIGVVYGTRWWADRQNGFTPEKEAAELIPEFEDAEENPT